jgi:hypothetical protein
MKPVYHYDNMGRPVHTPPDEPILGKVLPLKDMNN